MGSTGEPVVLHCYRTDRVTGAYRTEVWWHSLYALYAPPVCAVCSVRTRCMRYTYVLYVRVVWVDLARTRGGAGVGLCSGSAVYVFSWKGLPQLLVL